MATSHSDQAYPSKITLLDGNGENMKQWRVDLLNAITKENGFDISNFTNKQGLPANHTQHPSKRYEVIVGGVTVDNMMVDMLGTFRNNEVKISEADFNKLSAEDRSEIQVSSVNNHVSRTKYVKVNVAAEYTAKYIGDPVANTRVKVSHSDFKFLSKEEGKFVKGLAGCAAFFTMYLSQPLRFKMENCDSFKENRRLGRTDMMLMDIERMVISNNAGEVVEPNQFNFPILRVFDQIVALRLSPEGSVPKFLNVFDGLYQKLALLGFGESKDKKPEGEDTLDYMFGIMLIRACGGLRFDVYINKADADKQLKAPICDYAWATLKIKTWNDELANGYAAIAKRKATESFSNAQVKKIKVMMTQAAGPVTFSHGASASKGASASGGKSAGPSQTGKSGGKDKSFETWKANFVCDHCKEKGHFASDCTTATQAQRETYRKVYLAKKAKKNDAAKA
jgi:hypothetical protein